MEFSLIFLQIVTKPNRSMTLDLLDREKSSGTTHVQRFGKLTICAEESVTSKTTVELIFRCSDLESRDLFSKSVNDA